MISRRKFLSHGCTLGAATAAFSSSLLSFGVARTIAAQSAGDYRALVCILLAGGNDSYNMLIPTDQDQYGEYQNLRSDLALPIQELLPLSGTTDEGRGFALHPGMPEVQALFDDGELGLVANVGTLVEPLDTHLLQAGTAKIPLGLFSHADQIAQWQTAVTDSRVRRGWAGRIADLEQSMSPEEGVFANISLSGNNLFQSGERASPYSVEASGEGVSGIFAYDDGTEFGEFRKQMIDQLLAVEQSHLLRREYGTILSSAIGNQQIFAQALASSQPLVTEFSGNHMSQSLHQIARVMAARELLGQARQVFFVTIGGWDHHDDLISNQARMLPMVSKGLQEFRNALDELGLFDQVTTFTISDFGRTLTSNGKGSDHGWGGHHLVMGGAVKGGQIYGNYPLLYSGNPLDVGRGVYAPTTSVDEYFADLALWYGVSANDLDLVLPNIRRFHSPESGAAPLDMLHRI